MIGKYFEGHFLISFGLSRSVNYSKSDLFAEDVNKVLVWPGGQNHNNMNCDAIILILLYCLSKPIQIFEFISQTISHLS